MLFKLLKFIIVTRFSKAAFIFLIIFISLSSLNYFSNFEITDFMKIYLISILSFLAVMTAFTGGIFILKSDTQYLFLLPLEKRTLATAFFISQVTTFGVFTVFFLSGYVLAMKSLIAMISLIFFAILFGALSIISHFASLKQRGIVALLIASWFLSSLLNFEPSPTYVFIKSSLISLIILAASSILSLFLAYRRLMSIEIGISKISENIRAKDFNRTINFTKLKGSKAIYMLHLAVLGFTFRINFMGVSRYVARRIRLQEALLASIGIAIPFAIILDHIKGAISLSTTATILTLFIFFISTGTLSNERLWLAFTSIDPAIYLRKVLFSKMMSVLIILSPFVFASFLLYLKGFILALSLILVCTLIMPSFSVLITLLIYRLNPRQIKEEEYTVEQVNVRELISVIPVFIMIGISSVAAVIPLFALIAGSFLLALSLILILNKDFLREFAYRLADKGFI